MVPRKNVSITPAAKTPIIKSIIILLAPFLVTIDVRHELRRHSVRVDKRCMVPDIKVLSPFRVAGAAEGDNSTSSCRSACPSGHARQQTPARKPRRAGACAVNSFAFSACCHNHAGAAAATKIFFICDSCEKVKRERTRRTVRQHAYPTYPLCFLPHGKSRVLYACFRAEGDTAMALALLLFGLLATILYVALSAFGRNAGQEAKIDRPCGA